MKIQSKIKDFRKRKSKISRARIKADLFCVHFSCVICIAAAFQLLPLFIFSMFIFVYFFTQTDPTRTVQRSALCRSRRELSNAYLLAKIGVDTAENEPLEVWGENSIHYSLHSLVVNSRRAAAGRAQLLANSSCSGSGRIPRIRKVEPARPLIDGL